MRDVKERKKGGKGEMEGVLVKSEGNGGKRRVGNVDNDSETPKCNKRRRREPVMAAVSGEDKGEVQDPSTTNTTATVKRSSLFRGVSRSGFSSSYSSSCSSPPLNCLIDLSMGTKECDYKYKNPKEFVSYWSCTHH